MSESVFTSFSYSYLHWSGSFRNWDLVQIKTPGDGNCLFHALLNGFFLPYRKEELYNRKISKLSLVKSLRGELADRLAKPSRKDPRFLEYELLHSGNLREYSKFVPEFSLETMQARLRSSLSIGHGYLEFIANVLEKDIYILEANRQWLYRTDEKTFSGKRNSLVLLYLPGHYELLGLRDQESGKIETYFSPNHPFIRFLLNMKSTSC